MKTFLCTNIDYDFEFEIEEAFLGHKSDLPETMIVVLEDDLTEKEWEGISEDEIAERLADAISNETGWCVGNFLYEEVLSTSINLSPRAN